MLTDLMYVWAVILVLVMLWVVVGAANDWAQDITVSLLGAVRNRCVLVFAVIQRLCGKR